MPSGIPLGFVTLDPDEAQKALVGFPDVLTGDARKAAAVYAAHSRCKNGCGHTMVQEYGGTEFAFADPDIHVPRCIMRCSVCGFAINPFDGMVIAAGDTHMAQYGVPRVG